MVAPDKVPEVIKLFVLVVGVVPAKSPPVLLAMIVLVMVEELLL